MLNDEVMNKIMAKCKEDPKFLDVFENLLKWSQSAALAGMSVEEMASICMMGYAIGEDPGLQEMVKNMNKISKLGLDIVEK